MTYKIAGDGMPFRRFDRLMLWALPGFLVYVAGVVGGSGWRLYLLIGLGVVAGVAVIRGIEAALGESAPPTPSAAANVERLAAVIDRTKGTFAQGLAQLDKLQALAIEQGDRDKVFGLAQERAMLTVEDSRRQVALAIEELQSLRSDERQARGERIARFAAWAAWAAAVAAIASAAVPALR